MSLKHSVCRWCFDETPLPVLAEWCQELGIQAIDLLHPHEVLEITDFGLTCPITAAPEHESGLGCIERAFNNPAHHPALWEIYKELIPKAAEAGILNVITFSGNREGLSDAEGIENCAAGLDPLLALAEKHNITLIMELLNSKVDHPGYQCDHTDWGIALCQKLGSPRFKLLYDIYHMQVMEGNVMATIRRAAQYIGHYHTAGCPGRNELDETQELYYPAIIETIRKTGYDGFLAQEFVPTWDNHKEALADAIRRCV
jgi:hydroxypyruvate isomerase